MRNQATGAMKIERPGDGAAARAVGTWTRQASDMLMGVPIALFAHVHGMLLGLVGLRYRLFLSVMRRLSPAYMEWAGRLLARSSARRAARRVPAYARFLRHHERGPDDPPETDKTSYIQPYTVESRCVNGALPRYGTVIDESSGSTGMPYDWVRSPRERQQIHRVVSYFAAYGFGTEPHITINAFSQGAWATGLNMGMSLQRYGTVKNTGPDIHKILHTLRFFGPGYPYLIAAYPPFLKHLLDTAEAGGFPIEDYRLDGLVGGEGMSEGLRDYLLRRFRRVYSGYGATDLELGIAGETPLTVAIRRMARDRTDVRKALFGADSRLPMLFQYNPLMHYVEMNSAGELIVTINRPSLLSPRIRYNVHDEGGVARYDTFARRLSTFGISLEGLAGMESIRTLRLPFLWVYGRRDHTISVMGANIYPEDIEQCLYAEPDLARLTHSYALTQSESPGHDVRPCFLFEVVAEPDKALHDRFAAVMHRRLHDLNADYREACREYPEAMSPEIRLYRVGEGPFAGDRGRIKQARLLRKARP